MANRWQLALLKLSIPWWNKWRERFPKAHVDLSRADLRKVKFSTEVWTWDEDFWQGHWVMANLSGTDLSGADLSGVNLYDVDLQKANLSSAKLEKAILTNSNLSGANLSQADLTSSNLYRSNFFGACLDDAKLTFADLRFANLCEASLCRADILQANFLTAYSEKSNFSKARAHHTMFGNIGLNTIVGLESIVHNGPSIVSSDALSRSQGKIPDIFLRGCGLSDWEIEQVKLHKPSLSNDEINEILYRMYDLRATQALQIFPLFISYSHADGVFVDKLEVQLDRKGIRFWRDLHEMKAGRIEKQIDRAIRQNPTVLLILSKNSLSSDWVEHEVRTARGLEKEMGRDVLCPVALDDSWKYSSWPKRVMEQIMEYNILDFSDWKNDNKFDGMFRKLIDGLELFYKG